MNYLDLSIEDMHQALKEGKVTPEELTKLSLARAHELQASFNPFVTIDDNAINIAANLNGQQISNPLFGIPCAIKDNYSTKGILSTGSSNTLKDYVPVYDATVVTKLKNAGSISIGKTVLDELAMGGTGLNGHTGIVYNPWCPTKERIAGGSSAGSAVAVCAGIVPFALGSDTGDSVRKPAAYCGCVGFKPTWGRISRYGLFPFAPSLDHVAFFTRTVKDSAYVLETLAGEDACDMTCSTKKVENYSQNLNGELKGKKIAIINGINNSLNDKRVTENFFETVNKMKQAGAIIIEENIDVRLLKAILPVYMVISCSEATSNDANLDGIKFGPRVDGENFIDTIIKTRTEGFSELIKRRFILGSYCLAKENQQELFLRAQKIRRVITNELNRILSTCDAILFPSAGSIAPLIKGSKNEQLSEEYLIGENHLALGNFAGLPSLTLPSGFVEAMPVGVNVTGKAFDEQGVLDIGYGIEKLFDFKNQLAKVGGK